MRSRPFTAVGAAATTLVLGASLLAAPPALADENSPHSPAERTVPAPDTWSPSKADQKPAGGKPPEQAWRPADADDQEQQRSPGWSCSTGGENLGIHSWYPMERHQISDRLDLDINVESGNAVLRHRDLTIRGTGLDLNFNSVYNSRDLTTKWKQSYGRDIGLMIESDRIAFHGPTGSCDTFHSDGDGGWETPSGVNAELVELANGTFTLTYTKGRFQDEVWYFNSSGWATARSDRNGNKIDLRYTTGGNLASATDTQGRTTRVEWDEENIRPTRLIDPTGETAAAYEYSGDSHQPSTLVDRAGQEIDFGYTDGYLTSITDATGATWQLSYDTQGRVTSLTAPTEDGGATTEFDHGDGETTVTDPNGGESVFEFDDQGRQTTATDQVDNSRSQEWTANSDVATTTDALDASVTYDYDNANNLIGTELPTGAETSIGYADSANPTKPTSVTSPDGDEHTITYDQAGNPLRYRSTDEDITVASLSYNGNGTVASVTDGNLNRTTYDYDAAGNMVKLEEPGPIGAMTYTYDALSRVTSVTDGNGVKLEYGYDKLDRVVSISRDGELIQSTTYDGNGRTTATHTDQASLSYTYDGRGDLLKTVRSDADGEEKTTYAYDAAGNLTEMTELGATTTYTYDAAFRLDELTDPTGATTAFDYDENNRRTGIEHPDGATQSKDYDESGRLTSLEATNAAGEIVTKASYSYDNDGSDSGQLQSTTVDGETEDYTYDGMDRLTSDGETDYTYDDAGNLLSAGGDEFTYNNADQATQARGDELAHDKAGNLVEKAGAQLQYSPTNQWTKTDTAQGDLQTSISYDTANSTQVRGITDIKGDTRIDRQVVNTALGISDIASDGERTRYVRDPNGTLISMIDGADDTRYHYTTDHQSSVLSVTQAGSEADAPAVDYDYTPYGQTTTNAAGDADTRAAGLNPFTYTGAYQFQNGTLHLGHRFFSPGINQFTQPDPSRQERNNYTYAGCDPINNTDPTGLMSAQAGGRLGASVGSMAMAAGFAAAGACAVTAPACLAGMAVGGAAAGAAGGALGASLAGGSGGQVASAGAWGGVGGAITGPMPVNFGMWTGMGFNLAVHGLT
ncbi:RHS repeat-associated core domain-containing protein [Streptomonospora alba]|uniref:RHS repeat-associated core domain-containing protein n=1 Tax=Streptomonospora alba TaxID=183763 RepID=UPI001EE77C91|nr:RHS repeat-associated core domain-containing protein [Streptomonospora alba]